MASLLSTCASSRSVVLAQSCKRGYHVRLAGKPVTAHVWLPAAMGLRPPNRSFLYVASASSSSSPQWKVPGHSDDSPVQVEGYESADELKTVRVKFKLQKACDFGRQFFLTGEDPALGIWDPEKAIPMNWSDDHIWTIELDLPVDQTILFKFILKISKGVVEWQPGADRVLQTWETKNTIVIYEDWEKKELQNIIEEEICLGQTNNCTVDGKNQIGSEISYVAAITNEKEREKSSTTMKDTGHNLVPVLNPATQSSIGELSLNKDTDDGNSNEVLEKQEPEHIPRTGSEANPNLEDDGTKEIAANATEKHIIKANQRGQSMEDLSKNKVQLSSGTSNPVILNFGFFRNQLG